MKFMNFKWKLLRRRPKFSEIHLWCPKGFDENFSASNVFEFCPLPTFLFFFLIFNRLKELWNVHRIFSRQALISISIPHPPIWRSQVHKMSQTRSQVVASHPALFRWKQTTKSAWQFRRKFPHVSTPPRNIYFLISTENRDCRIWPKFEVTRLIRGGRSMQPADLR